MTKKLRGFEVVKQEHRTLSDEVVKLPIRSTKTSAGYDFFATQNLVIKPQQKVKFKTDVKAYMDTDEVLLMDVRSSIGAGSDLMIANTIGVVDSDFYENVDDDGNIRISLRNLKPEMTIRGFAKVVDINGLIWDMPLIEDLTEENTVTIKAGERVAQGIFVKYLEADNGNSDIERTAGTGSTGK